MIPFLRGILKTTVVGHLCAVIQPFPKCILFQNKDVNDVLSLKSVFLHTKQSINFLWPLVELSWEFPKAAYEEEIA